MLAWGAAVGLASSIAALLVVPGTDNEPLGALIRLAMVAPAALYVLWWLLVPGLQVDAEDVTVEERVAGAGPDPALLESIFNAAREQDDYSRMRPRLPHGERAEDVTGLRHSIRHAAGEAPAELRPRFRQA